MLPLGKILSRCYQKLLGSVTCLNLLRQFGGMQREPGNECLIDELWNIQRSRLNNKYTTFPIQAVLLLNQYMGMWKYQMKLFRLTKLCMGSNWNTLFTNNALLNTISSGGQRQAAEQSFLIPQIISKRALKHTQISFIPLLKLGRRRSSP